MKVARRRDVGQTIGVCFVGIDPNVVSDEGRTALHGAAHKGRNAVVQLLADHGAKLDQHDFGSRDTGNGDMLGHTWIALNYAEGLVRVGVQSALPHPKTATLLRKLMAEKGLEVPPPITSSICVTEVCKGKSKSSCHKEGCVARFIRTRSSVPAPSTIDIRGLNHPRRHLHSEEEVPVRDLAASVHT